MTGGSSSTRVVQITNIAPQATKDQMQSLFGSVGKIDEIRLYPTVRDVSCPVQSRICYVKYIESHSVPVAQHLTNTVFIDRALIVIPVASGQIPDEYRALEMASNGTLVPGLQKQSYKLPPEVVNRIDGFVPNQVIRTDDPKLSENNLPEYPPLPVNFDARKIEETRRTINVIDIPSSWKLDQIMDIFKDTGEVKYARFAESNDGIRMAMIEFCEQKHVISSLKLHGTEYEGRQLNLYHSTQPITKPEAKSNEAAQKEIEEAMSIVKEAQSMISAAIDPVIGLLGARKSRTRSKSRKRTKTRSRSRSRSRRHKSRSRDRKRSRSRRSRSRSRSRKRKDRKRSRSRDRKRRSRSRDYRKKSRSRERKRRSRSRDYRHRSRSRSKRSRSRDKRRRSYSRERERVKKSHRSKDERRRRDKSRSRSRSSKPRSRSRGRSSHSKRPSYKSRDKVMRRISEERPVRDYDAEERIGHDESDRASSRKSKSISPEKSDNMDISNSP
uniref:CSON000260 protein n=1 Tax=Culicoides sonorensis TaxID=179676 RepID=A0A336KV94_CULSO